MPAGFVTQTRPSGITHNRGYQLYDKNDKLLSEYVDVPLTGATQKTTSWRGNLDESLQSAKDRNATNVALNRQRANSYDNGHEFSTETRISFGSHQSVYLRGRNGNRYEGSLSPWKSGMLQWIDIPAMQTDLYGQRAIQATVPTKSVAGLATTFGELLKDGLPDIEFLRLRTIELINFRSLAVKPSKKDLGGEFLNWSFAWAPLQADVMKAFKAVFEIEKIMRQYERDSGKVVRRNMKFPVSERVLYTALPQRTFTPYNTAASSATFRPEGDTTAFWLNQTDTLREQYWFRGAYSYYLAPISTPLGQIKHFEQVYNKLLGTRVTPEVLYNLIPWSWLVDWFTNIGGILANVSSFLEDELVLRYGYLMRYTTADRTYTIDQLNAQSTAWTPGAVFTTFRTTRKERKQATPYGFGLNTNDFSPFQWAILIALGMTKGENKLR